MAQSGPDFKAKLVSKTVIVKLSLFSRAFSGTVTATDDIGFCFDSDAMASPLREVTGSAMKDMDAPIVYLPFAMLEWMVFSEAKAASASA